MRNIPFGMPLIGQEEKNAVAEVMNSPILVHGPRAIQFEQDFARYTKSEIVVSVSSCTAGLHLFWFINNIGPGDEIIVPAMTHVATVHSLEYLGAKPVFVDVDEETGNIDIDLIEEQISDRTKGICVVHYLGVPVDMDKINDIASRHKLLVLEDCALALGSRFNGRHVGLHGDAGSFSFYPVKHITTAEGGVIISKNEEIAEQLKYAKAFGVNRDHTERALPGDYDVVSLGLNFRMSEIHAAIGIEQLQKLDTFIELRSHNWRYLKGIIEGSRLFSQVLRQENDTKKQSSFYCLVAILNEEYMHKRADIMKYLTNYGIGTSVYYPRPVPSMSYYRDKYGYQSNRFPNSERIAFRGIAFPVGPHVSMKDLVYMKEVLTKMETQI